MDILKKPYEISLWEDFLTFVYEDGTESEGQVIDGHGAVTNQYYKERKICVIGSDTMDTPIRAFQPKLNTKINGENILTFDMYSHYYDLDSDELYINPYINLLINERKIKVRYGALGHKDTKWYDLIIKNIQENSETKTYNYTAKSQFVNELSKSGFNLEFNQELENNMGNIETLAERVLDGSDWRVRSSGEVLKQTIEEPLYYVQLTKEITLKDMEGKESSIILPVGTFVYVFYNNIVNRDSYVQFQYAKKYEIDDDHVIINSPNWFLDNVTYNEEGIPNFTNALSISTEYRGKRLVRKVKTTYDATIDKYVNVYNEGTVYGYTETEYISPAYVRSYVTNPNSYSSYAGWEVESSGAELDLVTVPDMRDVDLSEETEFKSCLKLDFTDVNQILYNSGIVDSRQQINGFVKGEKYVFRVKYGQVETMGEYGAKTLKNAEVGLKIQVNTYELSEGKYILGEEPYFSANISYSHDMDYAESLPIECTKTLAYSEMIEMGNQLGLFIQIEEAAIIYLEDVQFFPYVESNGEMLLPNEAAPSEIRTMYYYYTPNAEYKSIDEVKYLYKGESPSLEYQEDYNGEGYEKIRSITASESNRFNLIQELCEIFECWPRFEIEHNPQTGEILFDEEYRQKKWVSFHEYVGNKNYTGFKYGINLKSIQRTIDSEGIVSKLIVKNNSNEFATDGFCSISRANENPSGENFILDFGYYIQHGMLGLSEITNDLYSNFNGFIGYYKELKRINTLRDQYIKEQSGLLIDISEYQALLQTYQISVAEAEKQYKDKLIQIKTLTGLTFEELMKNKEDQWWVNDQVQAIVASLGRLKTIITNHGILADKAQENLTKAEDRFEELARILSGHEDADTDISLLLKKEELHAKFYKKYSRFLQEGSWISEDYIDDNLYFLDAQSTLTTSAKPKITYNILVLELSQLQGYENFTFALGDKTTIEDTEFFGWVWNNGVRTPYKEEIVVTELTIVFDSPEQNQIKVQNYKTQFEDLFQRMAATTQSVEYSTGKYQKASNIVESDGTIKITTLQNSILNNSLILQNAKDQSVIWDETGITTTNISNPSEVLRIVSGGVFLSTDGGLTWNTGITGNGINANYITSGQIDVERINVLNGSFSSFRWDKTGISAYEFSQNQQTGEPSNFNYGKFVRLDQYGLYAINGNSEFDSSKKDPDGLVGEDKIWKSANFALTWKGFMIKSNQVNGGYVSITSNDDIQVFSAPNKERVKLGLLENGNYGLRLKDENDKVVMEHSSDGKVWIKNEIKIGSNASTVSIGYLDKTKELSDNIHEVINANDKFIVYEDGSMKATDGEFTGIIHATGGTIGGLEIQQLEEIGYEVVIETEDGIAFTNGQGEKTLVAHLYKGRTLITEGITSYQWYRFSQKIEGANKSTLNVQASDLGGLSSVTYSCVIKYGATT